VSFGTGCAQLQNTIMPYRQNDITRLPDNNFTENFAGALQKFAVTDVTISTLVFILMLFILITQKLAVNL
jgi:hypothetical protein